MRANLADTIDALKSKDYFLVAKNGAISSALVNIDFLEDLLALKHQDYLSSIRQSRKEYQEGKTFTHEQVFGEL